ncbi:MAG: PIN domain-containing protein [Deltaproteobacteria bacterium]|nr:PIN domain-containing protein [Deltaproteobacteria bacterium]
MSGERVLLDSVILIDHFNGLEAATSFIRSVADKAAISPISRAEVLTGFDTADEDAARSLLDHFVQIQIDAPVADLAARLRREHRWKLPDAIQAAVAIHHGLLLITRDAKDFAPGRHSFVRIPYRV